MKLDRKKAPVFKQIEKINFLATKQTSLHNGLITNTLNGGSQDIIKLDFIFKAGVWQQTKPLVANATNQLIKEGTKSYSANEIAEGIDLYGAFLDTAITYDSASVTLYTLSKHLIKVLPYFFEIISYPKLSQKEFKIYQKNALEKFKINQEKVSFVASRAFNNAIFGGNCPYGTISTLNDYNKLKLKDIKAFHKTFYDLANCEIIISGKVTEADLKIVNQFFGEEKIAIKPQQPTTAQEIKSTIKNKVFIPKANALQSAIRIGMLMPNKLHKDYFGLQVLNTILGGYFGSRLMKNIREDKGYTYGIYSRIISLQKCGYFTVATEVDSKFTKQALKEIYKEIALISATEVSQEELDLVKNYLLGQFLSSCDGPFKMASLFENVHFYDLDYEFYNHYIKTIKAITPKAIKALGVKYFDKANLKEIVVGKN